MSERERALLQCKSEIDNYLNLILQTKSCLAMKQNEYVNKLYLVEYEKQFAFWTNAYASWFATQEA